MGWNITARTSGPLSLHTPRLDDLDEADCLLD